MASGSGAQKTTLLDEAEFPSLSVAGAKPAAPVPSKTPPPPKDPLDNESHVDNGDKGHPQSNGKPASPPGLTSGPPPGLSSGPPPGLSAPPGFAKPNGMPPGLGKPVSYGRPPGLSEPPPIFAVLTLPDDPSWSVCPFDKQHIVPSYASAQNHFLYNASFDFNRAKIAKHFEDMHASILTEWRYDPQTRQFVATKDFDGTPLPTTTASSAPSAPPPKATASAYDDVLLDLIKPAIPSLPSGATLEPTEPSPPGLCVCLFFFPPFFN